MKERTILVNGMHCRGCENRIRNSLLEIEGVKNVTANYMNKTVQIEMDDITDMDLINKIIEDLGFEIGND